MSTAAAWSAGSSPRTCALRWSATRCGWPSAHGHATALKCNSSTTATADPRQYSGLDFAQVLDDYDVLQSVGSVGDALDNALAESFVDTLKTELIADRVWRTRSQLELAIVEYLGWFNHDRLHQSLGDLPPAEFEALHAPRFLSQAHSPV